MGLFDDLMPAGDSGSPSALRITVRPPGVKEPIPPQGRALLDTIAGSESPGYNTLYGGGQFDGYADHPRQAVPITSGPNVGKTSSAAGRYQFLGSTWDQVKQEAGLPDFSPDSQDQGAWYLADKTYRQKTGGRDLAKDIEAAKGNPNAVQGIGKMLSGVWTSLPGGIEPNNATMSFAGRYDGGTAPTELSSQAKRSMGLFNDLVPQGQGRPSEADPVSSAEAGADGRFSDNLGQNFRTAREGESPAVATKSEAFEKGLARGVTFNFIDELNAIARAGGLDPNDPDGIRAAIGLLKGGYRLAKGDPEAQTTYRVEAGKERDAAQRAQEQQPGMSLAGELAGAVALPIGGAARGATLGARSLSGARAGAAVGALSGVGEGTDTASRVTGGLIGGGTGAALGAAAPAAVEGIVQGSRLAAKPFGQVAQVIRGINDPEAEAARRVTAALQRDAATAGGPAGLTPAEFAASRQAGGPAAIMDLGGETTRALARSAANTSPEGRAALNKTINDRFESQSDRVSGWLNQTFGASDTGATREALQQAARQANRPAYARAYHDGDQPLWTPELQRLVGSPDVVDAMRAASERGKSRAITEGFGGFNSSVQVSPTGVVEFTRGKNGQPTYPNLQFWDYTKRALDDSANAARRAGRNDEAGVLGQLATSLRNELDGLVPSYQGARAGAARFFGANDALEAGEKFLTSNAPLQDARRALGQMSQPERDLFREGFVQSLTQKIESTGDRRNVLNAIAQSPRAQQQLELALGPQKAKEFESMMRVEGVMELARSAVQGNSTTARQLTELGLAGGAYGLGTGGNVLDPNPTAMMNAALVYGAAKGKGAIDKRVSQKVAEMLTSNDANVLRKGIQIVSRNQSTLNALRQFDLAVTRSGSQQTPSLPAIQSMGIGRAENDQPQVQGP